MSATRRILDAVARGDLTPDEAFERLRRGEEPAEDGEPRAGDAPSQSGSAITTLQVRCSLAEVRIVGDPTVAGAIANGPHEARTEGSTLIINDRLEGRGFTFGASRNLVGIGRRGASLEIRANPRLDLQVDLKAGELAVAGMDGPIGAVVTAGSLRLDGFTEPIDLQVKAGTVEGRGRLTGGTSKVQCKLGEVRLDLDPASDVEVVAHARVGEVRLPDGAGSGGIDSSARYVFGAGTGRLDIDTAAGAVEIRSRR